MVSTLLPVSLKGSKMQPKHCQTIEKDRKRVIEKKLTSALSILSALIQKTRPKTNKVSLSLVGLFYEAKTPLRALPATVWPLV